MTSVVSVVFNTNRGKLKNDFIIVVKIINNFLNEPILLFVVESVMVSSVVNGGDRNIKLKVKLLVVTVN